MFFAAARSAARVEILHEGRLGRGPLLGRHLAGEAMDLTAAERDDVVERLLEDRGEFLLPARDRRHAEFSCRLLAGRGVDAEHREAVTVDLGPQRGRRVVIHELQFDRPEARRGRGAKALDQRTLGEQVAEVGGEARHSGFSGRRQRRHLTKRRRG